MQFWGGEVIGGGKPGKVYFFLKKSNHYLTLG
jgi:hypothetical protein